MTKIMLNIPGGGGPTDKFKFTGKWRCGEVSLYHDTDIWFEVELNHNFLKRWFGGIPRYYWARDDKFVVINICDDKVPARRKPRTIGADRIFI